MAVHVPEPLTRREIAVRFRERANRRAVRLQADVAFPARRMRRETPEKPRARAGRGFGSRRLCANEQKIRAPSLRLEP
jgi:hypothetical protein